MRWWLGKFHLSKADHCSNALRMIWQSCVIDILVKLCIYPDKLAFTKQQTSAWQCRSTVCFLEVLTKYSQDVSSALNPGHKYLSKSWNNGMNCQESLCKHLWCAEKAPCWLWLTAFSVTPPEGLFCFYLWTGTYSWFPHMVHNVIVQLAPPWALNLWFWAKYLNNV